MATRVIYLCAALLGFFNCPQTPCAQQVPPAAYQLAAEDAGIPASVLFAVAQQESGLPLHGRLIPWPWTLNVAGVPARYPNRAQACSGLRRALLRVPATRVDVGLGQVNVGYHGHRVEQPCALLDPHRNLTIAATILREQHTPGEDWLVAIGRYYRPAEGPLAGRYRLSVQQRWARASGGRTENTTKPR